MRAGFDHGFGQFLDEERHAVGSVNDFRYDVLAQFLLADALD